VASEAPLAAIIHISDLHFGSVFHNRERWFHRMLKETPVQGCFPHDYQVAQALNHLIHLLVKEYREQQTPLVVVHTGDLTRAGKKAEFSVGATFLHSYLDEAGYRVGLKIPRAKNSKSTGVEPVLFDVPGNHDIRDRKHPDCLFRVHYPGPFPIRFQRRLNRATRLIVYGLDSNRGRRWAHRLANGEIDVPQIEGICTLLRKDQTGSGTAFVL
jgi:hypothetical protein